jgi:hypothetical protein
MIEWPIAADIALKTNVGFRGTADIARSGHQTNWQRMTRTGRVVCIAAIENDRSGSGNHLCTAAVEMQETSVLSIALGSIPPAAPIATI